MTAAAATDPDRLHTVTSDELLARPASAPAGP